MEGTGKKGTVRRPAPGAGSPGISPQRLGFIFLRMGRHRDGVPFRQGSAGPRKPGADEGLGQYEAG